MGIITEDNNLKINDDKPSSSSMKSVDSSLEHFTDIYWYFHKVTGNAKKHMMPYIQG